MRNNVQKTVDELRPMDDILFHKLAEDRGFCEELLRCILEKPDLTIIENIPQRSLKNIHGRSVILDLLCQDSEHNYFNVELQNDNHDNHQRRVRYNGANVDTYIMEKGTSFRELPELYVVYISDFDIFKGGRSIYHIERVIHEKGKIIYNGFHEIYVNAENNDGSDVAGLMSILKSIDVTFDERFPRICGAIQNIKQGKEGNHMCEAVRKYAEEYAQEYAKEKIIQIAKNMIKNGFTAASIHDNTELSLNQIQRLMEEG